MSRRKRDNPEAELRRALLEQMRDENTRQKIADALIRVATGEGKGAGDVIKGYEKIMEIIGADPLEDGASLSVAELARRPTAELRVILTRL